MSSLLMRSCAALGLVSALAACASAPSTLYSWNGYNDHVYNYLKSEASPEEQVLALEKGVQEASAKGRALPPGYYAHLGLMYLNSGRTDQALSAWSQEKAHFPESTPYIGYLINNMKKNKS